MSVAADAAFGERSSARAVRWSLCLLLVLAAHAAIALFLLSVQIEPRLPVTPPPAVLLDLAPLSTIAAAPVAPQPAREPEVQPASQPLVPQPESLPPPVPASIPEAAPPPAPEPVPISEPEPMPKQPELLEVQEPPPEPSPAPAPAVTLPTPPPKPKPVAQRRPKPLPRPHRVEPEPVPQRKVVRAPPPARAVTPTAPTPVPAVAPQPSPGAVAAARNSWQARLLGWLSRHKHYPRAAQEQGQQGTAYLRFVLDRNGRVLSYRLDRSSGSAVLDEEVMALIRRAQPFPPPPPELQGTRFELVVPVDFSLRHYR